MFSNLSFSAISLATVTPSFVEVGEPKLLLMNEPTRGVDIGAKFDIYATVRTLSAQGCAMIMTSSDLPELIGMCDRILVLQDGRQTHLLENSGLTSATLLSHFYHAELDA